MSMQFDLGNEKGLVEIPHSMLLPKTRKTSKTSMTPMTWILSLTTCWGRGCRRLIGRRITFQKFGATLSQLRSSFCHALKSYEAVLHSKPDYGTDAQTMAHPFRCPAIASAYKKLELWVKALHCAHFLSRTPAGVI